MVRPIAHRPVSRAVARFTCMIERLCRLIRKHKMASTAPWKPSPQPRPKSQKSPPRMPKAIAGTSSSNRAMATTAGSSSTGRTPYMGGSRPGVS